MNKNNSLVIRPGPSQTSLYSHISRPESLNFGFKKKNDCTIFVAKTKALISCAFTCAFVFAYAYCWFSYATLERDFKYR